MSIASMVRLVVVARIMLGEANRGALFASSKKEAMQDLNYWRTELSKARRIKEKEVIGVRLS